MIYIVRHGQTNWNLEGRNQGRKDVELNEKGISQAKITADKLKGVKFDKVFSSPLKRALKTAQLICDNEIITDCRLQERCNGELEGKLKTEVTHIPNFNDFDDTSCGIEPLKEFRGRIKDFLDEINNNFKAQNILIVTHAGVSIYMRCYFEGEPQDGNYNNYKLKNCQVLKYKN